ncbi:MAG: metallophosphoesterase family protein, partial [Methanoregulaceae archaeon]|nr:metallophosphoesterase family protein [Methanoregulaceae archaeon]
MILVVLLLTVTCHGAAFEGPDGGLSSGTELPDTAVNWGPYITNTTQNSTTLHWRTDQPVIGTLEYTPITPNGTFPSWIVKYEDQPTRTHSIFLRELAPGQTYAYRIGGSNQEYSFRTYPVSGPVRFIVYGDTREQLPSYNQSTHHALVANRIAAEPDVLFVVHTGDLVNNPDDNDEWDRFFSAAGPMLANTTFYAVPGNHEGDLQRYQELFGFPSWYSFMCGGAEMVMLNSNALPLEVETAQDDWLNQTLDQRPGDKFVFLHHPLYTSEVNHWGGFTNIRKAWEPVFIGAGVTVVFSAHVHTYEHYEIRGIHYFTLGTGGAPFYPLSPHKPAGYVSSLENTLAYARVTVNPTTGSTLIEVIQVGEERDNKIHLV